MFKQKEIIVKKIAHLERMRAYLRFFFNAVHAAR